MGLSVSVSVCLSVCVYVLVCVTILSTGHTLANIKKYKNDVCLFLTFTIERRHIRIFDR